MWLVEKLPRQDCGVILVLGARVGVRAMNQGADILLVVLLGLLMGVEVFPLVALPHDLVNIPLDAAKLRLKVAQGKDDFYVLLMCF